MKIHELCSERTRQLWFCCCRRTRYFPQDFTKSLSGRCHVTLCGAADADRLRFRRAGEWAVQQAFASYAFENRAHQSDSASGFHFEDDRTGAVAFHRDARFGGNGGEDALEMR
jgi:hypothetical protein